MRCLDDMTHAPPLCEGQQAVGVCAFVEREPYEVTPALRCEHRIIPIYARSAWLMASTCSVYVRRSFAMLSCTKPR